MNAFYEFDEDRYWVGGATAVAIGPAGLIEAAMPADLLLKTFGGYVSYMDDASGRRFLGVWQGPRIQHFYRELSARGVAVRVETERPSWLRLMQLAGA